MMRYKEIPLSVQMRRRSRTSAATPKLNLLSRLANWAEQNPAVRIWIRLNQSLTAFTFFVATVGFLLAVVRYNEDQRKADEDRIAKAWDVITRMAGKQSNGGQVAAIERLNAMTISLNNIDLHNTYLAGANLKNAKLQAANFSGAVLIGANFVNADLRGAKFRNSILIGVDLTDSTLDQVDFTGSKIINSRIDIGIVLAQSLLRADLTNSIFVFEDDEGEKWDVFSDTISESKDDKEIRQILESACAHPKAPPKMNPLIAIQIRYKRCNNEPDYYQLSLKYPSPKGIKSYLYGRNPFL
jgi:hypothetical protein